jgi:hypothetical protein
VTVGATVSDAGGTTHPLSRVKQLQDEDVQADVRRSPTIPAARLDVTIRKAPPKAKAGVPMVIVKPKETRDGARCGSSRSAAAIGLFAQVKETVNVFVVEVPVTVVDSSGKAVAA